MNEKLKAFLEASKDNTQLAEELKKLSTADKSAWAAAAAGLARQFGHELAPEDLMDADKLALSEDELAAVAGTGNDNRCGGMGDEESGGTSYCPGSSKG